jgi:general secretion pathway protein A
MYLSFYNLKTKPFQISTDPKFLWLGENYKEALASLKYGIMDNKGFLLLTGGIGTGKTTLINALVNSLGDNTIVAIVPDPDLEKLDFFNFIANAFKINKMFHSKGAFIIYMSHFLHNAYNNNKKVLLIIDEAQRLNPNFLEEIRTLSNIEKQNTKLINIFFVGQNEFNDILMETRNRALRQRITINYNLDPLAKNETGEYIRHRLKVAGSKRNIFTSDAIREIFSFSEGYPRLINIICDFALLTGYATEKKKINSEIIKECAEELQIHTQTSKAVEIRQETLAETKQQTTEKIPKKTSVSTAGYIGVLTLLLLVAGYLYFQVGYKHTDNSHRTIQMNNADSVVTYSANPDNISLQEEGLTSQKYNTLTIKEKDNLNSSLSPKKNNDLTVLEERDSDKNIGKNRNEKNADDLKKFQLVPGQKLILYYGFNSTELSDDAFESLNSLAETIIKNPDISIVIKGYTDKSGRFIYNKKLSEFRANTVKSYLVGKGVSQVKIKTIGMGPLNPIVNKESEKGIRSNRRVEIEFNINKPG